MSASTARPSLAALIAAVRADVPGAAHLSDADVADIVRTASTTKGAVWLVRRATGPAPATATQTAGRWDTAMACLSRLAADGDARAARLVALAEEIAAEMAAAAIAADLSGEEQPQQEEPAAQA